MGLAVYFEVRNSVRPVKRRLSLSLGSGIRLTWSRENMRGSP